VGIAALEQGVPVSDPLITSHLFYQSVCVSYSDIAGLVSKHTQTIGI